MCSGSRRRASRRKAATGARKGRSRGNKSGVVERGMSARGPSEELGRPDVLHGQKAGRGNRAQQAPGPRSRPRLSAAREARAVEASGNERQRVALWSGWRDGRQQRRRTGEQESEARHRGCEGGELNPGGPAGGKGEAGSRS